MEIKPWDEYFLDLAKTCATRSNCIRAQVGAVIVGQDKKIKATGYNGTPSKVESCAERGECYRIKNNIPKTEPFTFGDTILFAYCVKDSLYNLE